ncbi:thiamine pyrophosphate-binding protein [Amphritea opalescens]|uniref:Thiamine pyrophosphate-binding protein n=1 Tax=Amphritea opalescens TaxID=2490544 RepID=A0A430KUW9_9GAMM|nr:thiamine pyrophosphate-binding protein [Amphritea opalescens]RTE67315.1 thiamine pyrophosphate-binding protein [Amphritea opalescens]
MVKRTGGNVLINALKINSVEKIFGVPGESYLAALDALYDQKPSMEYITCRQEGGSAFMASAYARLTGKAGVCFVTRGPGATNASIGVHTAFQDSAPMILLIGQAPRRNLEREAFQEIDYRRMFGQMAKWVAQIDDPARIPEFINRAFQVAQSGRPGPVVLALPEDMLREETDVADLTPAIPIKTCPGSAELLQIQAMLAEATKPLVIIEAACWEDEPRLAFEAFCLRNNIPVAAAFRRQSLFDNHHECYVGDLAWGNIDSLTKAIDECDLLIGFGARLDEGTTCKYTTLTPPFLKQKFIHIYPQAEELGRVFKADLMVNAGISEMALALSEIDMKSHKRFANWRETLRQGYIQSLTAAPQPGDLDMGKVMAHLREVLPRDTIVTTGAGNCSDWPNKIYQYSGKGTNLSSVSGAMGYGVPAAVMASIVYRDRTVVCISGDGDFLMNGQELATAVQYGGTPIILVVNNGMYGTIRMHQQIRHTGRVSGTDLVNPDFSAYAKSFGAYGETVKRTEDFAGAFERARNSGLAAILELQIDPESICYNTPTLSDLAPI